MASSLKLLRFPLLRSTYLTPPRARPLRLAIVRGNQPFSSTGRQREEKRRGRPRKSKTIDEVQDTAEELHQQQSSDVGADSGAKGQTQNASIPAEDGMTTSTDVLHEVTEPIVDSAIQDTRPEVASNAAPESALSDSSHAAADQGPPSPEEIAEAITNAMDSPEGQKEAHAVLEQVDSKTREAVVAAILERGSNEPFMKTTLTSTDDEAFIMDNVTSVGHEELERQREYREYARLAAWELPLLSKLAKPFAPPTRTQVLRFRYTSYLGEDHPAASKVVVEFCTTDLPDLTPTQRDKLVKLLGVRFNPDTRTAKLSCDSFPSQAENREWLADRVRDLLDAARDGADTFEDVPFDFRHHRPKTFHEFPKEWILTEERKRELAGRRAGALREAADRLDEVKALQEGRARQHEAARREAELQAVAARRPVQDMYSGFY